MMNVLDEQTLRHTDGGFLLPLAIYLGYRAYQSQTKQKETTCDWGNGSFGGGGAGGSW